MNLKQAIKNAIPILKSAQRKFEIDANMFDIGFRNPVNEHAHKEREKLKEMIRLFEEHLEKDDEG